MDEESVLPRKRLTNVPPGAGCGGKVLCKATGWIEPLKHQAKRWCFLSLGVF